MRLPTGWMMAACLAGICTAPLASAAATKEVELPKGKVCPQSFSVSADGRYFLVDDRKEPAGAAKTSIVDMRGPVETSFVDATTGKARALASLLPDGEALFFTKASFCGSGSRLALHAVKPPRKISLYVVDLATGKKWGPRADVTARGALGGRLLAAKGDPANPMQMPRLMTIEPFSDRTSVLKIHAMPMGVSSDGSSLLAAGDPASLGKPISMPEAMKSAKLLVLDPTGKLLYTGTSMAEVSSPPMISPKGKFIIHQIRVQGRMALPVRVSDVTKGTHRDIPGSLMPVHVFDSGAVIVRGSVYGPAGTAGGPMHLIDTEGNRKTLLEQAGDGYVVGGRLYYLVYQSGPAPKVRWIDLPKDI